MPSDKEKIAICVPLYGNVTYEFLTNFMEFMLHAHENFEVKTIFTNFVPMTAARNYLVKLFLDTDADYLLFLDSDIIVPKNILERLIKHDKDIISALYFDRMTGKPEIKKWEKGQLLSLDTVPKGKLAEIGAIGLGCCLIKREVIEKAKRLSGSLPIFKAEYLSKERLLGEDYYFFALCKRLDFKAFCDTSVIVGHYGSPVIGDQTKEFKKLGLEYGWFHTG